MLRVFSYGGGVQSTAALVLAAQGKIDFRTFLFCNVGEDSENPATLQYFREYAQPYAHQHGIDLVELFRVKRNGEQETLYERLMKPGSKSWTIPVRMRNGAPAKRKCTGDFKIKVIAKWQKAHGATEKIPAITGLGISIDEFQRMRTDSGIVYQKLAYPLIDLRLSRHDCVKIIADSSIPVPPKSACYFCPFHRIEDWRKMSKDRPDLFEKSLELEATLGKIGKSAIWLTKFAVPLDEAINTNQQSMFDDTCESGYCMT